MNQNYHSSTKLLAAILLFSLFLQSCGGFKNHIFPEQEIKPRKAIKLLNHPSINTDKEIVTSGGYLASFYEEDGELKADLRANEKHPKPTYKRVTVLFEEGVDLVKLTKLDPTTQKNRIELNRSHNGQLRHIIIRKGGLSGGMKRNMIDKEDEKEEKEKQVVGDLAKFPSEVLSIILSHVDYSSIANCMMINKYFYELIKDNTTFSLIEPIDFAKSRKLENKSPETINKFFFGQLIGEVRNLPERFWPHLKDTNIHTVDLSGLYIGSAACIRFTEHLQGTKIRKVNFGSGNYINDYYINNTRSSQTGKTLKQQYPDIEWLFEDWSKVEF